MLADRKNEHLDIVLSGLGRGKTRAGFDDVVFEHVALPELSLDQVALSTQLLGKRINAPFLVSSMTGGPARAERINRNIAVACQSLGIAFAVGSQRVAIEGSGSGGIDGSLRRFAPDIPILANFGAAQLNLGFGTDEARRAIDMIDADALVIHLNPLQEALQPEGNRDWRGLLSRIEALARSLDMPIVAKEVGAGIAGRIARRLVDAGVSVIDVAGSGGTSWASVEAQRATSPQQAAVAHAFANWGVPTAHAIVDVRRSCPDTTIVGSGGIRDGIDAAKAIRIGADIVGQAGGVLEAATISAEAVIDHFAIMIEQLRVTCFCTGSADLSALKTASLVASRALPPESQ